MGRRFSVGFVRHLDFDIEGTPQKLRDVCECPIEGGARGMCFVAIETRHRVHECGGLRGGPINSIEKIETLNVRVEGFVAVEMRLSLTPVEVSERIR